jgi:type II secretory pathway pseudopilin PulG
MNQRNRRFSQCRGVTLFEVGVVGSIVAMGLAVAAIWLGPRAQAAQADETIRKAVPIRRALEAWQRDNAGACPSVSQLVYEEYLAPSASVEDPWGNRFRILCDGGSEVVSPGIDGTLGTSDDVILRVED